MSDDANESFDLDKLQQLVEMMEKHDLREVKLQRGSQKWLLRRGPQEAAPPLSPLPQTSSHPHPAAAGGVSGPAPSTDTVPTGDEGLVDIKSPTVGTFYQSPTPGDPVFVKIGDRVTPEKTVCIIEAMKVFNSIPAKVSGTIAKVLVQDGDAVDFGQALFKVKPE